MIKYHALIKTAELGSISKAAAALDYSQPGLSYILSSFEEELGFKLFVRKRSGIKLTEDGKKVLKYCREMLDAENKINDLINAKEMLSSGIIKIGAFASALVSFIPKAVKEFSNQYPNIRFHIEEYQAENMVEDLKTGRIDIAFIATKHTPAAEEVTEGYTCEHLLSDRICLFMHKDHPLAEFDTIKTAQLKECDILAPSTKWAQILSLNFNEKDFKKNVKHFIRSDISLFSMVSNNVGVALLSNLEEPAHFDNVIFRDLEEDTSRSIDAYISDFNKTSPAIKEFIAICKDVIAENNY